MTSELIKYRNIFFRATQVNYFCRTGRDTYTIYMINGKSIELENIDPEELAEKIIKGIRGTNEQGFIEKIHRLEQQIAAVSDKVNVLAEMYDELRGKKEEKNDTL